MLGRLFKRAVRYVRVRVHTPESISELFRHEGAAIGERTRILTRSLGSEPFLVSIGDDTLISSEVLFITHDGSTWVARQEHPKINRFGRIDIGSNCFIGARVILLPGTRIGDGSIVGAGSVVKGEIAPGVVVAGVPARVVCSVDEWVARAVGESLDLRRGTREELRGQLEVLLPGPSHLGKG